MSLPVRKYRAPHKNKQCLQHIANKEIANKYMAISGSLVLVICFSCHKYTKYIPCLMVRHLKSLNLKIFTILMYFQMSLVQICYGIVSIGPMKCLKHLPQIRFSVPWPSLFIGHLIRHKHNLVNEKVIRISRGMPERTNDCVRIEKTTSMVSSSYFLFIESALRIF